MPLQSRLLRTYSRRGGRLRLLPQPERWISPPPDRKRFFSSTSAGSSAISTGSSALSAGSSALSIPSDDPEFSPPLKLRRQPQGKRPWRLRPRGGAEKENRPPGRAALSSPSSSSPPPSPAQSGAVRPRRRRAPPRPLVGRAPQHRASQQSPLPAGTSQRSAQQQPLLSNSPQCPGSAGTPQRSSPQRPGSAGTPQRSSPQCPEPTRASQRSALRRPSRRRRPAPQRPLLSSTPQCNAPQRPLLCSTPQCSSQPRRLRAAGTELSSLALLSTSLEGSSGLANSPELYSPLRSTSNGGSLLLLESPQGDSEQLPPVLEASGPREEGAGWTRQKGTGRNGEHSPQLRKSTRVLRASARRSCLAQTLFPPAPQAVLPQLSVPCDSAASDKPCNDFKRDSTERILPGQTSKTKRHVLTPVVVLDHQEVLLWLMSMKCNKAAFQHACQQPVSPLGPRGVLENKHKRTKVAPGEGSTCRKACISGLSASRWGRQMRLVPKRLKNKRKQQPNDSLFRPQVRQKEIKKGFLDMSESMRDNDYSLLNTSHYWDRVRASLSFHKKKKVMAEESFCNSILCTSVKSQLSVHQAALSVDKAQYCTSSASSMVLLAPRNSSSALEFTLTDAEKVFGECQQEGPISFEDCIPLDKMKDCKKIGEGVFGEVFQVGSERGPVALKIIPIEGTERVNGEAQKSFGEILPEIIISKELSLLSEEVVNRTVGFISLYAVHCVQGAYPKYLLEAWDKYNHETGSENDRPDLFGDRQLFMVLEFEFGGRDLENMRQMFSSVASARSILHQVTASLAVAEQALHFEHRDLHWGNVLVKKTNVKELKYVLNGVTHSILTKGIHVNIIDYTLSRLEKDGLTVFCDLSTDEELFQGRGDYQYDIYRQMKAENSNNWTDYHPHTNVLWLHYLSAKLLKDMCYKNKESTSALRKIKWQLNKFHKEVLTFQSANEVLQKSSLFQ